MSDYIDALSNYFFEQLLPEAPLPPDYLFQKKQTERAFHALEATFSPAQRKLYLAWEAEANAYWGVSDDRIFRQAFLLGRRVFR